MPFEYLRSRFQDILDGIGSIERFIEGMDLEAYAGDERTQAAVERKLPVISESAIRLKNDAERLSPAVPWREIRGIRNWLRHQYDRVDLETIWNTIQDDLPSLKRAVSLTLESLKGPE
ncbi:MAG: HepT-like ribonuclease domain-containing protein [Terracidiphilus sp.]|jgi:uncharacterized protein with HEPN domain